MTRPKDRSVKCTNVLWFDLKQPTLWRSPATNPLLLLALLFLADSTFATATSIAPRLSLWGSYERLQGLYTTAAYLVIFFSIVTLLRTEEQLKRLLTTVLVVSFPVSLYGIIQHFGIDPVPSVLHNPPLPLLRLAIYSVLLSAQLAASCSPKAEDHG